MQEEVADAGFVMSANGIIIFVLSVDAIDAMKIANVTAGIEEQIVIIMKDPGPLQVGSLGLFQMSLVCCAATLNN